MTRFLLDITTVFAVTLSLAIGFATVTPPAHAGGPCDLRIQTC